MLLWCTFFQRVQGLVEAATSPGCLTWLREERNGHGCQALLEGITQTCTASIFLEPENRAKKLEPEDRDENVNSESQAFFFLTNSCSVFLFRLRKLILLDFIRFGVRKLFPHQLYFKLPKRL